MSPQKSKRTGAFLCLLSAIAAIGFSPAAHAADGPCEAAIAGGRFVFFETDKSQVRPQFLAMLRGYGGYLAAHPQAALTVEGHTDERASDAYNQALGARRAQAVADLVAAYGGLLSQINIQIRTASFGENTPRNPGKNEPAWADNRRAEIKLDCQGQAQALSASSAPVTVTLSREIVKQSIVTVTAAEEEEGLSPYIIGGALIAGALIYAALDGDDETAQQQQQQGENGAFMFAAAPPQLPTNAWRLFLSAPPSGGAAGVVFADDNGGGFRAGLAPGGKRKKTSAFAALHYPSAVKNLSFVASATPNAAAVQVRFSF
jgi:hypothetical protein